MSRLRLTLLSLAAVFAVGAATASAAEATGGPEWITGGSKTVLNSGSKKINSTSTETYKLKAHTTGSLGEAIVINCPTVTSTSGTIIGGDPGSDETELKFTGCEVEGAPGACYATETGKSAGEVVSKTISVLVYPESGESSTEADDAFLPEESSNDFATFKLTGGSTPCGVLNNSSITVEASGSSITVGSRTRNVGIICKVGKWQTVFTRTISGEESDEGALECPEPPNTISKAKFYNGSSLETVTAGMKNNASFVDEESGTSKVETSPKEEFGWQE